MSKRPVSHAQRTLRSPFDRALLWDAADGKCEMCGDPLGDDWHADHIVPWVVTQRTNVHEMQALCKSCNLKKGRSMSVIHQSGLAATPVSIVDLTQARPGQARAFSVITDRVEKGDGFTAVVLPTRYGKSDVIRTSAYDLHHRGVISAALVLVPGLDLVKQMNYGKDWDKCAARYGLQLPFRRNVIKKPARNYTKDGEAFLITTIQLASRHVNHFGSWIESMYRSTGRPVAVYIDESQMQSNENTWGETAYHFARMGGRVVLLTATPYRSDGRSIPGFELEIKEVDERHHSIWTLDDDPDKIRVQRGILHRRIVRLRAHHETTFAEAWAETPSPLCKVSRLPFDIEIETDDGPQWLSQMTEQDSRGMIGKLVWEQRVIRDAVHRMVDMLRLYQKIDPHFAAMVYSANDQTESNQHGRMIKRELERIAPDLVPLIDTTKDDGESKSISDFKNGFGDVLIVKQKGGVGLDCSRIKVILDLSPIRQPASLVQRLMRGATPHGSVKVFTYICPDDARGQSIFREVIQESGGEIVIRDFELFGDEVIIKERPSNESTEDRASFGIGNLADGDSEDNLKARASADDLPEVFRFLRAFPVAAGQMSHADIAAGIKRWAGFTADDDPIAAMEDVGIQQQRRRDEANEIAREITKNRLQKMGLRSGMPQWRSEYEAVISDTWARAKHAADVRGPLEEMSLDELGLLVTTLQSMIPASR